MSLHAPSLTIETVDYRDERNAVHLVMLTDAYARDPMGGSAPLADEVREKLPFALAEHPGAFSLIARIDDEPVGIANCFMGFSTFAARPLVNIHDLGVLEGHRGKDIGARLLAAVEAEAQRRGACKITLEVLSGNAAAQRLYARRGFARYALDPQAGTAQFWEKKLP